MTVKPPAPEFGVAQIASLAGEDLRALGYASLFIIAAVGFVLIRSRFAVKERPPLDLSRRAPGRRVMLDGGRCRWRLAPAHDDGGFRAWSCRRCGAMRWTLGAGNPPDSCR